MKAKKKWSKMLLVGMILTVGVLTGCNTVTSALSYSTPVQVSGVGIVSGRAISYEQAWFNAVEAGKDAGFTKILSETTEQNSMFGQVVVTLVMTK
jgi:hypothetical protein